MQHFHPANEHSIWLPSRADIPKCDYDLTEASDGNKPHLNTCATDRKRQQTQTPTLLYPLQHLTSNIQQLLFTPWPLLFPQTSQFLIAWRFWPESGLSGPATPLQSQSRQGRDLFERPQA